ncbi:hypothetical protein KCU92_g10271, partial [Aureobasidium melanogenum]
MSRISLANEPSILDRIDGLPTEIVHRIFEFYWDLSSPSNECVYQLVMRPRDTFSVSTVTRPQDLGRTPDPDIDSPYELDISPSPRETRLALRNHVMLKSIAITFTTIDRLLSHAPRSIQQFSMSALTYTLFLRNHPNIRLQSLRALIKQGPARMIDHPTSISRTLDTNMIRFGLNPGECSRTPTPTRITEQNLHFQSVDDAKHFFYADMSRAVQIESFSYDSALAPHLVFHVLDFLCWSCTRLERCYCGEPEVYTVIYTKSHQHGASQNVDDVSGPLRAFVVRAVERSCSIPRSPFQLARFPAARSLYDLGQFSVPFVANATDEMLRNATRSHSTRASIHWPPKYVTFSIRDQPALKKYFRKMKQISATETI